MLRSLIAGVALAALTVCGADAPMHCFLLIGQSNMAGRGKVSEKDKTPTPGIFMFGKGRSWQLAKDPVHFDKAVAGVGLASEFARCYRKANPKVEVGLIPCAVGGSSLSQWQPGQPFYQEAIARAKAALARPNTKLTAILWHQGESDSSSANCAAYPARFQTMLKDLRKELGADNVPVLVGELGPFYARHEIVNAALKKTVEATKGCYLVSAAGLTEHNGDSLHFASPSLHEFGKRYYETLTQATK